MCAAYYDTLKAAFVASSCVRDEIAKSEKNGKAEKRATRKDANKARIFTQRFLIFHSFFAAATAKRIRVKLILHLLFALSNGNIRQLTDSHVLRAAQQVSRTAAKHD